MPQIRALNKFIIFKVLAVIMSAFTFDFDLEDDLDESFDAIPLQGSAAVPSVDKTIAQERAPEKDIPAEEIPLSALVRTLSLPSFSF